MALAYVQLACGSLLKALENSTHLQISNRMNIIAFFNLVHSWEIMII